MSGTRHSEVRPFDLVVVVGSLGALSAFRAGFASFPRDLPVPIVFDLHRAENGFTAELLARRSRLPVRPATDGLAPESGVIYLAPADRQLLVGEGGTLSVVDPSGAGPGHPTADLLLTSAAQAYGPRLIAVVLSGRLEGGARGVRAVQRSGGRVLVQEPASAEAAAMPNAALATGCVDFALPPLGLAAAIVALCAAPGAADLFRVRLNAGVRG